MCSPECVSWIEQHLLKKEVHGKQILEVGAYDVNGSVRATVMRYAPATYIGTDMRAGPGVDVVCPAEQLVQQFGAASFDLVLTICAFEHIRHWQKALSQIKYVCRPDGIIIFIAPARWPFHAYPGDYWRYSPEDIAALFADGDILALAAETTPLALTYAKIRMREQPPAIDLQSYQLYSVVTGRRSASLHRADFFTRYFAKVVLAYFVTRLPYPLARMLLVLGVGLRVRVLRPLRLTIQALSGRRP